MYGGIAAEFLLLPCGTRWTEPIGCRLVKRRADGSLLWVVMVETEGYSQDATACRGYRRRSPQDET